MNDIFQLCRYCNKLYLNVNFIGDNQYCLKSGLACNMNKKNYYNFSINFEDV